MSPFAISIVISVLAPSLAVKNDLHTAVKQKNEDKVGLLVKNQVLLNEKDASGFSPFHIALTEGTDKMVELFMDATGVDYELTTDSGLSPIHLAIIGNKTEYIPNLIGKGAKVEAKEHERGYSALHYAVARYKPEFDLSFLLCHCKKEVLEQRANKGETALHVAAEIDGRAFCLPSLLTKLRVDAKNNDGETALHITVRKAKYACVELLLSKGADIEMQNRWKQTPLDIALVNKPYFLGTRELVALGADISNKEERIFNIFYSGCKKGKDFEDEIMKITEEMFTSNQKQPASDLVNLYEKHKIFALYRVVRSLRGKKGEDLRKSVLEKRRKEFLKAIEHLSSTYAPVHAPHYDKWVKERFAANLALASLKLKVHIEEKDIEPYLREVLSQQREYPSHPWLRMVTI